jgi:sulfide:quinone oxidoreductase
MTVFKRVTDHLSVSAQLQIDDLATVKAAGFQTVICNRPDGESDLDQPSIDDMKAAAEAIGLTFLALPFAGMPAPEIASQQGQLIEAAAPPVLAYCRSGTRSITAWALSQAGQGKADSLIETASLAGYDLSGLRAHL